jgi:putative membrane protein
MIQNYSDHAANERTFLAWIRAGIATIAFGFVIEKFDLLVRNMTKTDQNEVMGKQAIRQAFGSLGHHDGLVSIFIGIFVVATATLRFVRTEKLIGSSERHTVQSLRTELLLSLSLIMAALAAYISLENID